jgi:hypothetical protein
VPAMPTPKNSILSKLDDDDDLVPDSVVGGELEISQVTLSNWTNNPARGFPPQIKKGNRGYRSRKALEAYKARRLRETVAEANRIYRPCARREKVEA